MYGQKFIDEENSTNKEGPSKGVHKQATSKLGFVKFELKSQMNVLKLWNKVWTVLYLAFQIRPFLNFWKWFEKYIIKMGSRSPFEDMKHKLWLILTIWKVES